MNINLESQIIQTVNADNIIMHQEGGIIGDPLFKPFGDQYRMGENIRIKLIYVSTDAIDNMNMYINIAAFLPLSYVNVIVGKGQYYYACSMPSDVTANPFLSYVATIQTTVPNANLNLMDDFKVKVKPLDHYRFEVTIDTTIMEDMKDYLWPSQTNAEKLLKPTVDLPDTIDAGITNLFINGNQIGGNQNIYGSYNQGVGRSPRVFIYLEDPTLPFPGLNASLEVFFYQFEAGWYFRGPGGQTQYFNSGYSLELKRNGNPKTNLSSYKVNDFSVYIISPDAVLYPIIDYSVRIIRTDTNNDNIRWDLNYESDYTDIHSGNLAPGKITGPMTNIYTVGANEFRADFKVNNLTFGAKYRLIVVAYAGTAESYKAHSWISVEYIANDLPYYEGEGFDVFASLDDYNREFTGNNLTCCIEERMRSKIKLEFPFNRWKNSVFTRLGLITSNDIRRYLKSVSVVISNEYYDNTIMSIVKNVYDKQTSNKISPFVFQPINNLNLNFSSAYAELTYDWRNRFESFIPNLQSFSNGIPLNVPIGNQYWGGIIMTVRWVLSFEYDDYFIPFTDEIIIDQFMTVKDYGGMNLNNIIGDAPDIILYDSENICLDEEACYAGVLGVTDVNYKLITNIVPDQTAYTNLNEAEAWIGNELPQLTTPKIINQDIDYVTSGTKTIAKFCVDGSKLIVNSLYQISALAKRFVDTGYRVTEKSDPRITEQNDKRTIN